MSLTKIRLRPVLYIEYIQIKAKEAKAIMKDKMEFLTQTEHAKRLGISTSTVMRAQRDNNTYKTKVFYRRIMYIWIDGKPQYNQDEYNLNGVRGKIELLTQQEHAEKLEVNISVVYEAQKNNLYKTVVLRPNAVPRYLWIDGEPQFNATSDKVLSETLNTPSPEHLEDTPKTKPAYIDIKEASELTGLSVTTLRRGAKSKRYPYIWQGAVGSKLLFNPDELLGKIHDKSTNSKDSNSFIGKGD